MKASVLIFALLLAGCVTTGIQEVDDNHYLYAKQDWMAYSGGGIKVEMFKEAREFCQAKGKKMKIIGQGAQDYAIGQSASAEIQFSCE
jgi:hypothetical protein